MTHYQSAKSTLTVTMLGGGSSGGSGRTYQEPVSYHVHLMVRQHYLEWKEQVLSHQEDVTVQEKHKAQKAVPVSFPSLQLGKR